MGVTKLFLLQGGSCPVAAVTAGLAKLNNWSMSSYANQFISEHGGSAPMDTNSSGTTFVGSHRAKAVLATVEELAEEFLKFMREHRYRCDIANGNLPLQDAVDLASFLVGLQSGKSKFAMGVPRAGGRTHVGVVTRYEGFRMLGEPELRHTHVGFVS
jgi:hypothetical protein